MVKLSTLIFLVFSWIWWTLILIYHLCMWLLTLSFFHFPSLCCVWEFKHSDSLINIWSFFFFSPLLCCASSSMQGPILQAQAGIRALILLEWDTWWTVNMQPLPPWCKQGRLANQDTITHIQQRPIRNTTDICSPGNYYIWINGVIQSLQELKRCLMKYFLLEKYMKLIY